jgi:multiple sugar transport system ATP-binding protein
MDEPLSNLDAKLRGHMRAELKHMQARLGVTTIYVTHDQVEAMTLAHRVALMDKGIVQQLATPQELYIEPNNLFVAQFIGSPPMNVLGGRLEAGSFHRDGGAVPTGLAASLADAVLGVRPEDCRIVAPEGATLPATIYAAELLGDHSLVTVESGADQIVVKAPKDFEGRIDDRVGVDFSPESVFLFDGATGQRIR